MDLKIRLLQKEEESTLQTDHPHLKTSQTTFRESEGSSIRPNDTFSNQFHRPGPVIGHVGFMLQAEDGNELFLGAHTGIHFLRGAYREAQKYLGDGFVLPKWTFGLHVPSLSGPLFHPVKTRLNPPAEFARKDLDFYVNEIDSFCHNWSAIYPIMERSSSRKNAKDALDQAELPERCSPTSLVVFFQLYAVMAINILTEGVGLDDLETYDSILVDTFPYVSAVGSIESLRGLLLYAIVLQMEGRYRLATQLNGIVVRLAQSLGLHRHSRRFSHSPSTVEQRKRLWWSVFICDTNTSLCQGLPRLIHPADVDVDLSMNIDCPDTGVQQLPILVPGEVEALGLFRQQIFIYQIYSEILDLLYTTWNRRDGVTKIADLEHKLDLWKDACRPDDYYDAIPEGENHPIRTALLRLSILADLGRLLIHRPALTFDASEPQFETSLTACIQASRAIIGKLHQERSATYLIKTWPLSLSILYQSAIMLLYPSWLGWKSALVTHDALRSHFRQVRELITECQSDTTVQRNEDPQADSANLAKWEEDLRVQISTFLESLLVLTINSDSRSHTQELSGWSHNQSPESGNCADWQSLMLPNAFLSSDFDIGTEM